MLSDAILNERPTGPVNEHKPQSDNTEINDSDNANVTDNDTFYAAENDSQEGGSSESTDSDITASASDGPNISVHSSDASSGSDSGSASGSSSDSGSFELSFDPADRPNATLGTGTIKELEVGDIAPDFTVALTNGDLFDLSDHDDKVVLINFWATWCSPCVGEMPELEELANEGLDKFELVCINCGEDQKTVDKFVSKNDFDFNIAYDTDYTVEYYYPTDYIPYTVVIKNGIVRDIYVGAPRDAYGTYKSSVETLLNE